jgi:hypothetical protein
MEASKATRQAANCESTSSAEGASAIIGGASGVDQAIVGTGTATGAPRDQRIVIRQAEAIMSISLSRGTPRTTIVLALSYNKNPAKDFCWWDLDGVVVVVVVVVCAVVDGSLDLLARSTCFFI